jgi:hypothetical protein
VASRRLAYAYLDNWRHLYKRVKFNILVSEIELSLLQKYRHSVVFTGALYVTN